mmetsp:Transcript_8845/g.30411  ORF Transcript_8845/g.30411 Transcript_8845/m.30411 type:complete len:237 (+) Transcript_8845:3293-4003(+)
MVHLLLELVLQVVLNHCQFRQQAEGDDRVWGLAEKVGQEAGVESCWAVPCHRLPCAVHRPLVWQLAQLVWLHALDLGLDVVKGHGEDRTHKAAHDRPSKDAHCAAFLGPQVFQNVPRLVRRRQLAQIDRHAPRHGHPAPLPQSEHALLLGRPRQAVEHPCVILPQGLGQAAVRGQPDHGEVCRVAHHGADAAGCQGAHPLLPQRELHGRLVPRCRPGRPLPLDLSFAPVRKRSKDP